jgi:predicted dehydrogenase
VLCEKPFAANASEAREVAEVAAASDRVVMEAFHWRYHPLNTAVLDAVAAGDFGQITDVRGAVCFPLPKPSDIRWSRALAGGSLMDAGCYPINMVRAVMAAAGATEPTVTGAKAAFTNGGVDRALRGTLHWSAATETDGTTGAIRCGMFDPFHPVDIRLAITGTGGSVRVRNPLAPQLFGHAVYRRDGRRRVERATRTPSYTFQMVAFRDAIREGTPFPSTAHDAVANMAVIDALYEAAGVTPHVPTPMAG